MARVAGRAEAEAQVDLRIAARMADRAPLAAPNRCLEAHRLTMHALEVLENEGSRKPSMPSLGPLTSLVEIPVENVAEYIVSGYGADVAGRLRTLYARRLVQCEPSAPERWLLSRAHQDVASVAPSFGHGGTLVRLLIGGAAVPVIGWLAQALGTIDISDWRIQLAAILSLVVVFASVSWVLIQGAAVAHRRSRLIMQQPLAALWETIGNCGSPPQDDSRMFALLAIVLTGLVWFVLPGAAALVLFLL